MPRVVIASIASQALLLVYLEVIEWVGGASPQWQRIYAADFATTTAATVLVWRPAKERGGRNRVST
jgi:hypothetical protein